MLDRLQDAHCSELVLRPGVLHVPTFAIARVPSTRELGMLSDRAGDEGKSPTRRLMPRAHHEPISCRGARISPRVICLSDVSPKNKYIITLNQWFDESLLKEKNLQPIYYPSINKQNLDDFTNKFFKKFNYKPNYLSLLSYDLVGLIYYLSLKNETLEISKSFKIQNTFKGKIGVFEIKDNKINHQLNFYEINDGKLREIF